MLPGPITPTGDIQGIEGTGIEGCICVREWFDPIRVNKKTIRVIEASWDLQDDLEATFVDIAWAEVGRCYDSLQLLAYVGDTPGYDRVVVIFPNLYHVGII